MTNEPNTPEPTDEQRAAWLRLSNSPDAAGTVGSLEDDVALIAPLLPDALTNSQPVLPTESGWYLDSDGDVWRLKVDQWWRISDGEPYAAAFAPFTRLVPERPQVTREQIPEIIGKGFLAGKPGSVEFNDAVYAALLNGTPDE